MNYLLPERLDALAREYAIGTLAGPARRRFERLLREQQAVQRAVAGWQQRLVLLAGGVPPLAPSPALWSGLQQRLFKAAPAAAPRWWQRLLPGSLAGSLAAVLLCVLVLRLQPGWFGLEPAGEALPASYVGLLTDAAGKPVLLASSRRQGRQLQIKLLQPLSLPAGRVAQLWALPRDGGAPVPVGVVGLPAAVGGSTRLELPDSAERLFFKVDRLGLSLEAGPAAAGSRPGADFVLSGNCVKLW